MKYSIGDVSKKMNIPASTIRFYDKKGLLPFVDRDKTGQRCFKENDLNFLEVIQCMKKCGMKISEIRHFIDLCMAGDVTLSSRYNLLSQEEKSVKKQINELKEQLDFLHYKMWYYKTALDAGTEDIHMVKTEEGKHVASDIHDQYREAIKHCHDLFEIIDYQNRYKPKN